MENILSMASVPTGVNPASAIRAPKAPKRGALAVVASITSLELSTKPKLVNFGAAETKAEKVALRDGKAALGES